MIDALQVCLTSIMTFWKLTSIMTFWKLKDTKKYTGRISALGILAAIWHQILTAGPHQDGLYAYLAWKVPYYDSDLNAFHFISRSRGLCRKSQQQHLLVAAWKSFLTSLAVAWAALRRAEQKMILQSHNIFLWQPFFFLSSGLSLGSTISVELRD